MPHRCLPLPILGSSQAGVVMHVAGALAAVLLFCDAAYAAWPADGVVLCSACRARGALIASDGAGGAFVVWTDARNGAGSNDDIFLQRVTASGAIAPGWPADGQAVCLASGIQLAEEIAPDGLGGVIVAWRDNRNDTPGGTSADIYAQRVLSNGSLAPGWPVDGAPVARTPNHQELPVVLPDGNGGAFITWEEGYASDPNIPLQYLAPDGSVMPGWPANGIPVCTAAGFQGFPKLAPDGSGGVFVAWGDLRDGLVASYAQRVTAAGGIAAGWPANGKRIVLGPYQQQLISDGVGGAFLFGATPASLYFADCYLQRFIGSGDIAPGWPPDGAPVCLAPDERYGLRMEPDGAGGVLMVWADYRDHMDDDVYALRMRSDGTRDPRWPVNGLPVTDNTALDDYPDLAPDGQGGAYLCWDQYSSATGDHVLIHHLTGAGSLAPGWPVGGLVVPSHVVNAIPHIVGDGMGGAIVAWTDYDERARALRIAADGPVVVGVSLVSAEAEPGRVRLTWFASDAASLVATVERRTSADDWQQMAEIIPDGTGRLEYEDRSVAPGARYDYRLAYRDGDALTYTTETWVEVPKLAFVLRGLTPNPCLGDGVVAFSLPSGEPATLELFDLTGRLVLTREVGSLGAGTHRLSIGTVGHMPTGVYSIRLVQGAHRALARGVVLR
jgi:hypothetical protein